MARNMYGATSADFTLTAGGRVVPGATLTVWSARTGGTQVTDLLDVNSVACTTVTSGADGSVVFYGPNNEKSTLWLDSGQGSRIAVRPVDITGETGATPALTIGTVTTGTAAATLTGTDEDPVLSLVLPSAGADGVNTAAIQAKAVTAAKIADDTITATQIAANAVGASELADNAVTAPKFAAGAITNSHISATAAIDGSKIAGLGNLLTANQASVETDSSPFGAFLNCTISRSTDHAAHGSACLKAIATAEGQVIAGLGATTVPVTPGETITGTFALKADRNLTNVRITIQWATGGSAGATVYRLVNATTAWVTHSLTVVVPAGVDTAGLFAWVTSAAPAGSEIYMDCFGLWRGAGGQWAMPGTPIVGLSEIATNGAVHLSGTGSPEGVVTAAPGSTWLQTDATTDVKGWIRWVKATGTGNTGWVAGAEADTGWRDVSASLESGASGKLKVRRYGDTVYMSSYNLTSTSNGMWTVPSGFRPIEPGNNKAFAVVKVDGTAGAVTLGVAGSNKIDMSSGAKGDADLFYAWSWSTRDAWPASLPGSAA